VSFRFCASDYPKTASHGRVKPGHKLFGPMLARLLDIGERVGAVAHFVETVEALGERGEIEIAIDDDAPLISTANDGFAEAHLLDDGEDIGARDPASLHVEKFLYPGHSAESQPGRGRLVPVFAGKIFDHLDVSLPLPYGSTRSLFSLLDGRVSARPHAFRAEAFLAHRLIRKPLRTFRAEAYGTIRMKPVIAMRLVPR
jgi:hypothetical protein